MNLQKETLARLLPELPKENLIVLEQTDSTNLYAKRIAQEGAPAGTVIAAKRQTAGRGSAGRSFSSPDGGLYLTVLLRPEFKPEQMPHLTPMLAVAATDAVEQYCGVRPEIKWVNDLVWGGKKLAGILAESCVGADGKVSYVAAGIGINCDADRMTLPPDVRTIAIGLREITGRETDKNALAALLARRILRAGDAILSGKADWMARYRENCATIGKEVLVCSGEEQWRGRADRVDDDGALYVTDENGRCRKVACGTVSVRGPYGYATNDRQEDGT